MTPHPLKARQALLRAGQALMILGVVSVLLLLAACGGGPNSQQQSSTTLRMIAGPGQPNPDLFVPYFDTNHGASYGAQGLLYEPLYPTNLYNGSESAWLASSYDHSNDLVQWTFHLRSGVKWSDGQNLTSADVKFTFDLMQQYPALDITGVWSILKSVSVPNDSTVVFTLKQSDSTAVFRLGSQIYIVPQHIWSSAGDPTKFKNDSNPVGTGPFLLKSSTPDLITYTVNPHYWGTQPQMKEIQIPTIKDNSTAINAMVAGKLDWMATGWNPLNEPMYSLKDPAHNHDWFAPSNTVMLYLNLTKAPFNNLAVRQAISAAIDRSALAYGVAQYAKPTNVTGVIPIYSRWITSQYQQMSFVVGQGKVDDFMQQAGYHHKDASDTTSPFVDASGAQFPTMTVDVPGAWSDWAQDVQNIVTDLNTAGIPAQANFQSGYTPYFTAISTGTYDAAISWTNSGPTPYYEYQALLSSSFGVGATVSGTNFERWNAQTSGGLSSKTDQYIAQYESNSDSAAQLQAIQGIEEIMVQQLPAIPLTANPYWDEYTTTHWTGWPDANNPYEVGSSYSMPDAERVILHLKPAS